MHIELTEPEHDELVATRRDLHQHPEPSWKEQRTASLVADRLRALVRACAALPMSTMNTGTSGTVTAMITADVRSTGRTKRR